jgi:hypothetical protein
MRDVLGKRFERKKYRDVAKKLGCKIETDFKRNIVIKKIRKILNTRK